MRAYNHYYVKYLLSLSFFKDAQRGFRSFFCFFDEMEKHLRKFADSLLIMDLSTSRKFNILLLDYDLTRISLYKEETRKRRGGLG